jgi:hypothetical protein
MQKKSKRRGRATRLERATVGVLRRIIHPVDEDVPVGGCRGAQGLGSGLNGLN